MLPLVSCVPLYLVSQCTWCSQRFISRPFFWLPPRCLGNACACALVKCDPHKLSVSISTTLPAPPPPPPPPPLEHLAVCVSSCPCTNRFTRALNRALRVCVWLCGLRTRSNAQDVRSTSQSFASQSVTSSSNFPHTHVPALHILTGDARTERAPANRWKRRPQPGTRLYNLQPKPQL